MPPSRPYTVKGNSKLGYPQSRVMKMNFPDDSSATGNAAANASDRLHKGETVTVVGASHRRGHLIVENNGINFHVPFQFMELVKGAMIVAAAATAAAATTTASTATTVQSVVGTGASVAAIVAAAAAAAAATQTATANVVNLM